MCVHADTLRYCLLNSLPSLVIKVRHMARGHLSTLDGFLIIFFGWLFPERESNPGSWDGYMASNPLDHPDTL